MKVQTIDGEMEHTDLQVRDVNTWGDNCRVIATEWYRNGKLVKRDVWVNVLKVPEVGVKCGF